MVESTKQVSENYLSTEKGYADDWAAYIASCHMTAEEALDYIRTTNTQEDRAAHLVDMADLSARSTFVRNGNPWVHCYEEQQKLATTDSSAFLDKMEQLFNAGPDEVPVLGKYRVGESQRTVVSVGTRVMIREEDGSDRPYLLLRLIPVEYLQNTWAFPTEFPLAEISMIVNLSINQNLRRAVDMAEHVNQAKTRFLSTMSHDIRTPMNAVIGMTEIAKLHLDDAGYVRDCLDKVSASSSHLLTLVNDILDLSRMQSGQMKLNLQVFCLTDILQRTVERYQKLLGEDYQICLEQNCRVWVKADELEISRVIYNFINNACHHTGEDKQIVVRQVLDGKKVRVRVCDHGEGIPEENLSKIWDRYYRVNKSSAAKKVPGNGLGLCIVKEILQAHHARYGVESQLGEGSTFWFELEVWDQELTQK